MAQMARIKGNLLSICVNRRHLRTDNTRGVHQLAKPRLVRHLKVAFVRLGAGPLPTVPERRIYAAATFVIQQRQNLPMASGHLPLLPPEGGVPDAWGPVHSPPFGKNPISGSLCAHKRVIF
jgi:hypothetical protein